MCIAAIAGTGTLSAKSGNGRGGRGRSSSARRSPGPSGSGGGDKEDTGTAERVRQIGELHGLSHMARPILGCPGFIRRDPARRYVRDVGNLRVSEFYGAY